jgi:hypothetical protein
VIKDWRLWLGAVGALAGFRFHAVSHEMAASAWVDTFIEADRNPGGPPANWSHGAPIFERDALVFYWLGVALMIAGVGFMMWAAKRARP